MKTQTRKHGQNRTTTDRRRLREPAENRIGYHAHLDVCAQCRNHPFALCDVGAAALCAEVGGAR